MKTILIAALMAASAAPALADTALVAGSGWQDDTLSARNSLTDGSNWTFTIASGGHFSVVDCCIVGDVYTLSGGTTGVSTFYVGSGIQSGGSYGSFWTSAAHSKISKYLGAGTYSIGITGDGVGGIPAGLGVRLDVGSVPEPTTWAMLLSGFGLIGFAMRRKAAVIA